MGVPLKRASILIAAGFVIGTFAGAALTSGVITTIIATAASAISVPAINLPHASASPNPSQVASSAAPSALVSVLAPPAATSALTQTTLLDIRIVADAANLLHASKAKAHASDIAAIIRSLATDATIGMDQASRLGAWPQAAVIAADRTAFYTKLAATAQGALQASVTNDKAYRRSATAMLSVLKRLVDLDSRSRGLAAIIGVTLPRVDLSPVR